MTKFIIFRHGQTDWNRERRSQGKKDIPLNETGRKQAMLLARRLEKEKIAAFYTSPLSRALETTECVASLHDQPIIILPELEELNMGIFEGKTKSERIVLFPKFDPSNDSHRKTMKMDTFSKKIPQLRKLINKLLAKHLNQTIALGTHDQKMRAFLVALGMPESVKGEILKNCALSMVDIAENTLKVIYHNDNSHLNNDGEGIYYGRK